MLWHHLSRPTSMKTLLVASSLLLISACGSGSKSDTTGSLTINNQPISGMSYSSATYSGVTDDNGGFSFKSGETISFTIYGLEFGEATAQNAITMADFEEQAIPTSYHDFERHNQQSIELSSVSNIDDGFDLYANPQPLDRLSNRLFLLYSLDADDNADNGIDLTQLNQNNLPELFAQVGLPINLNTFEFSDRMYARAKTLNINEQYNGFNGLAKFLADRNVSIRYPEIMCEGHSYNSSAPSQWSVHYKNDQQQSVLIDTFSSCAPMPSNNQAETYASTYSTDGALNIWYEYDAQNRQTHEYQSTNGTSSDYSRLYHTEYSELDGKAIEATSYWYDTGSEKVLNDITTLTYSENGLLESKLVDDQYNDLTTYAYNDSGLLEFEYLYSEYSGACWEGDISIVVATDTLTYYDSNLLKQRSDAEKCAINTYDYAYNFLGQTLYRKHNVDAISDTDPDTINYEYERTASFDEQGNQTGYSSVSRGYDGSLVNYQSDYTYGFNDNSRLSAYTNTSTNHNNGGTSSTSTVNYSYNNEGLLNDICYGETCSTHIEYTHTAEGLIETLTRSYNDSVTYKAYYSYNSDQLISSIAFFDGTSLNDVQDPVTPQSPDYETVLEYLPDGAVSVIDEGTSNTYYRDPNSNSDPNGYYQWFDLDLGDHLNRTLQTPKEFDYNSGDT